MNLTYEFTSEEWIWVVWYPLYIFLFNSYIVTVSSYLADSVSKLQCLVVVCLCVFVCAIAETPLPGGLDTSVLRAYR